MRGWSELTLKVRRRGDTLSLAPFGELDSATADQLRGAFSERGDCRVVVLDLRGLTFMDSAGLALIVEQDRRAGREGWALRLRPGREPVQRLFEMTGLARHLAWEPDGSAPGAGVSSG